METATRGIQVSNMPEVHGIDRAAVQATIEKGYDKLEKRLHRPIAMEVHFKEGHVQRKKDSQRSQVEAHVKVIVGGGEALLHAKHVEWDASEAVRGAVLAVEKEAEKVFAKK
ncbi:Uncharacterised protein [uncultured archaeon]|nr:Uncharacterised protein [uncultured archaeon]